MLNFDRLTEEIASLSFKTRRGYVTGVIAGKLELSGLDICANIGDIVEVIDGNNAGLKSEIVSITKGKTTSLPFSNAGFPAIGDTVELSTNSDLKPNDSWIGRVIDAFGDPLDGRSIFPGSIKAPLWNSPPSARERRSLTTRLSTKMAIMDTILPIARGQRIGIFAGSGVGKTTLLANLAKNIEAEIIVIGLVGERGREIRDFIEKGLGVEGMKRCVIVAATSDQSPLIKRRAAQSATAIAEYFRDQGRHVLLIIDSITRFAEAHREVALAGDENPSLRAYPPSTSNMIASLTERAGTGANSQGDITAIYSVLVAGADMDEPVADMTRGLLDGHIVLDREISERGRFPAINVRRSVSRSLPEIATEEENDLIKRARRLLSAYEDSEALIKTGLYASGSDPQIDEAILKWPMLDQLVEQDGIPDCESSFALLGAILDIE